MVESSQLVVSAFRSPIISRPSVAMYLLAAMVSGEFNAIRSARRNASFIMASRSGKTSLTSPMRYASSASM